MRWILIILMLLPTMALAAEGTEGKQAVEATQSTQAKPKVAVFPIVGEATESVRDRAGYGIRARLDRTGNYEVIDGPRMLDLLKENNASVTMASTPQEVAALAKQVGANIVLWGDISGQKLQVNILDLRNADTPVQKVEGSLEDSLGLRATVMNIVDAVQGLPESERPVEQRVWEDEQSRRLWKEGPNLLANGDFSAEGKWTGMYQADLYPVPLQNDMPPEDKVAIVRKAGEDGSAALVLHLSKFCAENNGMAAMSDPITIKPGVRYRLSYRYKSDGPRLFVFVKGYTTYAGPTGDVMQREIYRRQAPVVEGTDNAWKTIVDDFNPQHASLPIQELRVEFFAYLHPGTVVVDDAILKEVGPQTRKAKDDAIKPVATRPAERR